MTTPLQWRARKRRVEVLGSELAYVEAGAGPPIVLLHGNPTSSFLWRDVVGPLEGLGRCIVPDLLGMGDSAKLARSGPGSYRFGEHRRHLDALLDLLGVRGDVTLVVHDWGSALGFDWAHRHRAAVRGIAYTEAIVRPLRWDEWPPAGVSIFQGMRSQAGESMILERNLFVERILPASVVRPLPPEVLDEYRRPFATSGEDRRPTLTWPREIPLDGEPADVVEIVAAYADWLAGSDLPKLFINAEPGSILAGAQRDFCRTWPNQRERTVTAGHFVPEDAGAEVGQAVADWLRGLRG
jgi:haloalkane dehalogenase